MAGKGPEAAAAGFPLAYPGPCPPLARLEVRLSRSSLLPPRAGHATFRPRTGTGPGAPVNHRSPAAEELLECALRAPPAQRPQALPDRRGERRPGRGGPTAERRARGCAPRRFDPGARPLRRAHRHGQATVPSKAPWPRRAEAQPRPDRITAPLRPRRVRPRRGRQLSSVMRLPRWPMSDRAAWPGDGADPRLRCGKGGGPRRALLARRSAGALSRARLSLAASCGTQPARNRRSVRQGLR